MKLSALLFLSLITVWTSCNGQNTTEVPGSYLSNLYSAMAIGDTVTELGNNIMVIYQDKMNNYWFGSWGDGLYLYTGNTILHYTTNDGLLHNRIDEIREDKWGNLFFNTPGGINKFDGHQFTALSITGYSNMEWKLEPDDLWFRCTQDSGLVYRYDGKSLYRLTFPNTKLGDEFMASHPSSAYPNMKASPYSVYSIYKDTKGNIWFGTGVLGVCRFDGKSMDWISEEDVTELHDGPANGVRSIIEDSDGYFWFNSAYRYDVYGKNNKKKDTFYTREKSIGNLDGSPDSDFWEYMSIARDNSNALWIATYWNGVWRYDGKKTTYYPVQAGGEDITMFSIYKDNKGDLWLGTHESGAYKFNGKTFERWSPRRQIEE